MSASFNGNANGSGAPPPDLPVGRVLPLAGRGEVFFRHHVGPEAPTVLLLHGWTASADLQWWAVYERLGRSYPIVAPDHRGHGRGLRQPFSLEAAADDAAALVVALGAGPVIAVGYSMGGPIALLLAQRHPHLVSGLVLEATALVFNATLRERLMWAGRGALETILRSRLSARLAQRGLAGAASADAGTRERAAWLSGELRRADPYSLAQAGQALRDYDARPWAASLGVPAGVLLTAQDKLVRPSRQRALADAVRAEIVEVQGDHFAFWQRSAEFAAANERLVASVVARLERQPA